MDIFLIVITILIVLSVLVVFYFLAKYLKGSLKIILDKNSYNSGEKVIGKLEFKAKKQIDGNRLFVAIVAEQEERRRSSDGRVSRTYDEIYRFEQNLDNQRSYSSSFKNNYEFELEIPFAENVAKNNSLEIGNSLVDSAIKTFASNSSKKLRWKIVATLDSKGVDLTSSQIIYVNLKSEDLQQKQKVDDENKE